MTNLSGTNLNNGAAVGPQGEGMDSPSRFPTYPAYKDSGVEWLGEVPEGWILARGDAYLRSQAKVVSADYLGGKEVFHYSIPAVQATGDGQLEDGDEIDSSKLLVEQPQVLISKLNPRKNTVCLAGPREVVTVCSGEFVPLQSDCMDLKWVYYLVSSENFKKRLESLVESATRSHQRVNPSDILKFRGAFPLLAEQTQIARFLDHETARIDALIEEQQRLIELLKEKRQAVISHAVTKGLDPTVPMKDSGVEWLGEVPAHWDVMALKWRARIKSGDGISPSLIEAELSTQNSIPVIGGNGVMGYTSQGNVTPPLIVIGRVGALCGNVHKIYEPAWVSDNALVLEVQRESLDLAYLAHVLNARNLNQIADKSAQPLITGSKVTSQCLPCPCLDEQLAIAAFVDSVLAEFDELTSAGEEGIELLKERRSALISAAVTGKIDVRGWQPTASTQAPELEVAEAN